MKKGNTVKKQMFTGLAMIASVILMNGCNPAGTTVTTTVVQDQAIDNEIVSDTNSSLMNVSPVYGASVKTDSHILWHNSTTGAIKATPIQGLTAQVSQEVVTSSNTNLLPRGMADFTGDGKPDILFHNQNSGMVRVWEMDGIDKISNIAVLTSSNTNLQIAGVGDFDGDGDNDIATFDSNSGTFLIWEMDGTIKVGNRVVINGANLNLVPRGAGDMDNDGIPDIVLRNNNSGAVRVWTMNDDFTRKGNEYVTGSSNTNLELRGVVDINDDGHNDILNYNTNTGVLRSWLMDGAFGITENTQIDQNTDLNWSVRGGYFFLGEDFTMTVDVNQSTIIEDWRVLSSLEEGATAGVSQQGMYGNCDITGDTITYLKTVETNATDYCLLDVDTGLYNIELNVTVESLYWKQISAGDGHTVAIKSDGTLWSWGWNQYGQLGDGTDIDKLVPTQEYTAATNWSSVAAGHEYSVAIKSDGTLWSWGLNQYGQLGDGTDIDKLVPTQEYTAATNWSSVSGGYRHSVAIKSDNTLWGWGRNGSGQLGDGTKIDKLVPTQEYTVATNWSSVSAGAYHSVAIKSNSTLWSWGWGAFGQLGDGTQIDNLVPTQESTAATNWSSVSAGNYHTVAIKKDSTLWSWGQNNYGELGDGSTINKLVPTQEYTAATNWSSVSVGGAYCMAIKSEGTLWSWGWNRYGQLGDGSTINKLVATQEYTAATNWSSVAAGQGYNVAVKDDAILWVWGRNGFGQLGDGTQIDKLVPTQIQTREP